MAHILQIALGSVHNRHKAFRDGSGHKKHRAYVDECELIGHTAYINMGVNATGM